MSETNDPASESSAGEGSLAPRRIEVAASWLKADGPSSDVVVSSRVRLARNLASVRFVSRADKRERQRVLDLVRPVVVQAGLQADMLAGEGMESQAASGAAQRVMWVDLHAAATIERSLLVERHLISKQHHKGRGAHSADDPRAVAISVPDERLSIMVNEEDHLRIQVLQSGLSLGEAWQRAGACDDRIEASLGYAFSSRFGYLTACPTNVGTGLRMSVMLHLPGLRLTGEIDKVKRAAEGMNLAVRGFYGEGSEAVGDLFQISNQTTLGKSEAQILSELEKTILPRVVEYERLSRRELLHKRRTALEDQVWRAWGVLNHARLLTTEEAMQALSLLRMGVAMGLLPHSSASSARADSALLAERRLRVVNELMLLVQPSHLQRTLGQELDQEHRRAARAALTRQRCEMLLTLA